MKKFCLPPAKKRKKKFCFLTTFGLKTAALTPAGISSLTASPANFGLASPHNCMSQFLKIHSPLSFFIYICGSVYIYIYILLVLFPWRTWLIQYFMPFWQMMTTMIIPNPECLLSAFLEPSHVTFTRATCGQSYSPMIPMEKSKWVEITPPRSEN